MLESQRLNQKNYLHSTDSDKKNNFESVTFEVDELKFFVAEIKEMAENKKIIDIPKAIHNAKYFAEIHRRFNDVENGKNTVNFSDEEWEKFINAQDIS